MILSPVEVVALVHAAQDCRRRFPVSLTADNDANHRIADIKDIDASERRID